MGVDVPFLGEWIAVQAVQELADKIGVHLDLPKEGMLYELKLDELIGVIDGYETMLRKIMSEHSVSWHDVYGASDVGMERLALAEEIGISQDDVVLDVGCGRGYNTVALAHYSLEVCGLDLMNGFGRIGWWGNFRKMMNALGLEVKTTGVRSSATDIPFKDRTYSLSVSTHAVRNFRDKATIVESLKEMHRVTQKGGRVIIAENLPLANSKAQESHLLMYSLRTRYVIGDKPYYAEDEMVEMFEEAGLHISRKKILDFHLSAAPPIFVIDSIRMQPNERIETEAKYLVAVEMIKRHGESSPPVLLLEAYV